MRSTDVQIWPAFANAPCAAWSAAHSGATPASTISASLPPSSSSALPSRPAHASATSRPVSTEPVWMTRSTPGCAASGRPARAPPGSSWRAAPRESGARDVEGLDEPRARERRLLRRLVDNGVAGHERGGDLAAGDRDRVVPRHEQGDHAARLVDHQVGGVPAPGERPPAVEGPQLRVLLDRADARLDPAERVPDRLAALARLELGELAGVLAHP